jgi:regulatory protein
MSPLVTLEAIEIAGPTGRARRLVLSDGFERIQTSASVVRQLGLTEGDRLDRTSLEASIREAEPALAKDRAMRLLAHRDRSRAELERALVDSGYPSTLSAALVERLVEVELVNDMRFAAAYTRTRLSAGLGIRRIRRELADKGIAAETIELVINEETDGMDELARARDALRGRRAATRQERDKLVRRLVSRGFDIGIALEAISVDSNEQHLE